MNRRDIKGSIFEIQRFSIHDGPGIRTTVFLKGCSLRCRWCHNPESIDPKPALSFLSDRCIGCRYCLRACRRGAHQTVDGKHVLDRSLCEVCGTCTLECYAGALELVGREVTVGGALDEVQRDAPFYQTSGGGMTLSGGEPLVQIDFSAALLQEAKAAGLHCCIETCGYADFSRLERVMPFVDLFLYDVKDTDSARHLESTGVPNVLILENLRALHGRGAQVRLRLPIIPGFNDRADHFEAVAALVKSLPGLEGVQIMPYHRLGISKLDRLGFERKEWVDRATPETATVNGWVEQLAALGVKVEVS